jgi:hypothetical protein
MIVYGWREVQTAKEDISDCNCVSCNNTFTLSVYVFYRYVHVFWIPLFPIGKVVKSHCSSCGFTLTKKEMPESQRMAFSNMKKKNRIPVWMFSGLLIIGGLVSWSFIDKAIQKSNTKDMIQNPVKGDIYSIKLSSGSYTAYKVDNVSGDTVFLVVNEYMTEDPAGLSELKYMEYNDTADGVFKSDVEEMFKNEKIIAVDRH